MAEAQKGALVAWRQPPACDAHELPRRDVGEDDVRAQRQLVDGAADVDLAAEIDQPSGERVREPLRAAARKRPAGDMAEREQDEPEAGARPALEREHRVGCVAGEEAACSRRPEAGPGQLVSAARLGAPQLP